MAVPASPATAVSGSLAASLLNSYKSAVDWLMQNTGANCPYFHGYLTGAQTLTATVLTAITMDAEIKDTDSMHTGSNAFITVNTAGLYLVIATIGFPSTASGNDLISITQNGTSVGSDNTGAIAAGHHLQAAAYIQCAATDVITFKGQSTAGGALTAGSGSTFLQAKWVSL